MPKNRSMKEVALDYASSGLKIFPLHSLENGTCTCRKESCTGNNRGKHPRWHEKDLPDGLKSATSDKDQIAVWWDRWPDSNIGIRTGEESGIVVVDVDGDAGESSLRELNSAHGPLPKTWEAKTGRGRHLYFMHPGGEVRNSSSTIGPKLDIRGDGGYVVAPPSKHHTGMDYQWEAGCSPLERPLAEAPDFLLRLIEQPKESVLDDQPTGAFYPLDRVLQGVPEGERDESIYKWICSAISRGYSREQIEEGVRQAAANCIPPFDTDLAISKIDRSFDKHRKNQEAEEKKGPRPNYFQLLDRLIKQKRIEFFRDDLGKAWACVPITDHTENVPVQSKTFREYLTALFYQETKRACSREVVQQIQDVHSSMAIQNGPERKLAYRSIATEGSILIDMGTPDWRVIEISPGSWKIVQLERSPFKRFPHMRALPDPKPGGKIQDILGILPVSDPLAQILLCVWLPSVFVANIPRPILILHGSHGSGKTFASETLRELVDPSVTSSCGFPGNENELIQQLDHNFLPVYDNLGFLPRWATDALCRSVTGTAHSKRALYTNDEDFPYSFQRTCILNGISLCSAAPDLLDRSILIELNRIGADKRRKIQQLGTEFTLLMPRLFHAILDALAGAMQVMPQIEIGELPRLADWCCWGAAISESIGIGKEAFLKAFHANSRRQNEEVISGDAVAQAVLAFMASRDKWSGSPTDLFNQLSKIAKDLSLDKKEGWPKAPNVLSRKLSEIGHNLAEAGVQFSKGRESGHGSRTIRLSKRYADSVVDLIDPSVTDMTGVDAACDGCDNNDGVSGHIFHPRKKEREGATLNSEGRESARSESSYRHANQKSPDINGSRMTDPRKPTARRPAAGRQQAISSNLRYGLKPSVRRIQTRTAADVIKKHLTKIQGHLLGQVQIYSALKPNQRGDLETRTIDIKETSEPSSPQSLFSRRK